MARLASSDTLTHPAAKRGNTSSMRAEAGPERGRSQAAAAALEPEKTANIAARRALRADGYEYYKGSSNAFRDECMGRPVQHEHHWEEQN